MSLFQTETPAYRGQTVAARQSPGCWERIIALFRVETPQYKTKPTLTPSDETSESNESSPDESGRTDGPVLSQSPPCD